ncbi:MAG: hypothetical protein JST73_06065 [Actinobacteria bacterium]|nr:hypothetical protein [Actinomycetota bacterium]
MIAEALALWRYRIWDQSFTVALNRSSSDHLYIAAVQRSLTDHGWYFTNAHLGAPFGQQLYDFPQAGESLQLAVLRVLGLFSVRPFAAMNVYFLGGFAALAFVTFLVLNELRFRFWVASAISVLYTWLPYHVERGIDHLYRSAYLSAPISILVTIWVLSWKDRFLVDPTGPVWGRRNLRTNLRWRRVWVAVGLCLFIGAFETMVMAFTLVALVVSAAIAALRHRDIGWLGAAGAAAVAIAVTFGVLYLPNAAYKATHGPNHVAARRYPSEQTRYGLQIGQMLSPVPGHHIRALGNFSKDLQVQTPAPGEPGQPIGILGTIGFVVLLWAVVVHPFPPWVDGDPYDRRRLLEQLGIITLVLTLFGTMSGFALILSGLGFSQIRVWDRVVVLIAFCALATVAMGLERIIDRVTERIDRRRDHSEPGGSRSRIALAVPVILVTVAVTAFGLWDTDTGNASSYTNAADNAQAQVLEPFTAAIQKRVGAGGMIFQLPVVPFPENPPVAEMQDYEGLLPYVYSKDLSFSYGATKGRPDADWQQRVDSDDPVSSLDGLRGLGFDGVLVDADGYDDDGAAVSAKLTAALGPPVLVTPGDRWRFWDIRSDDDRRDPAALHRAASQLVGPTLMARLDRARSH